MSISKPKVRVLIGLGVLVSFLTLAGIIISLARNQALTPQIALLMFAALVGLYVGFGILIAVYRLVSSLD